MRGRLQPPLAGGVIWLLLAGLARAEGLPVVIWHDAPPLHDGPPAGLVVLADQGRIVLRRVDAPVTELARTRIEGADFALMNGEGDMLLFTDGLNMIPMDTVDADNAAGACAELAVMVDLGLWLTDRPGPYADPARAARLHRVGMMLADCAGPPS